MCQSEHSPRYMSEDLWPPGAPPKPLWETVLEKQPPVQRSVEMHLDLANILEMMLEFNVKQPHPLHLISESVCISFHIWMLLHMQIQ